MSTKSTKIRNNISLVLMTTLLSGVMVNEAKAIDGGSYAAQQGLKKKLKDEEDAKKAAEEKAKKEAEEAEQSEKDEKDKAGKSDQEDKHDQKASHKTEEAEPKFRKDSSVKKLTDEELKKSNLKEQKEKAIEKYKKSQEKSPKLAAEVKREDEIKKAKKETMEAAQRKKDSEIKLARTKEEVNKNETSKIVKDFEEDSIKPHHNPLLEHKEVYPISNTQKQAAEKSAQEQQALSKLNKKPSAISSVRKKLRLPGSIEEAKYNVKTNLSDLKKGTVKAAKNVRDAAKSAHGSISDKINPPLSEKEAHAKMVRDTNRAEVQAGEDEQRKQNIAKEARTKNQEMMKKEAEAKAKATSQQAESEAKSAAVVEKSETAAPKKQGFFSKLFGSKPKPNVPTGNIDSAASNASKLEEVENVFKHVPL